MSNLNEEASVRLLGRLTLLLPVLEQNFSLQLEAKKVIDETLYDYEVQSKCTDLVASDIEEKTQIYLACKRLEGLSHKTLENYRLFLIKLDQFFTRPCGTIETMDLRMFLAVLGKNKKATTINGYITMLKGFFGWLQAEEYILKNPAFQLKQTKVPKVIQKPYRMENLEILRESCETEKEKCLFELLDSTACRIAELDEIKIDDINFEERSILVTGKGDKERIVYFSTKAKLHLKSYIGNRESGYLFISDKAPYQHIKVRALQLVLAKIKKRANIDERVHCHKFRRTRATILLNSGMRIEGVQEILGHTTPSTTQIYAQLSQENLKNEYKRLVM